MLVRKNRPKEHKKTANKRMEKQIKYQANTNPKKAGVSTNITEDNP